MVDEHQVQPIDSDESGQDEPSGEPGRLTQSSRREKLAELAARIGEHAVHDGDRIVAEAGEPVVLHVELDREGVFTLTWWATALTESAHHRWREAAEPILRDGEAIYTSALGGGYLVEIARTTSSEDEAVDRANDSVLVERVRDLLSTFPDEVAKLPDEPVPDYLVPPEPELPPLGELEVETEVEDDEDDVTEES